MNSRLPWAFVAILAVIVGWLVLLHFFPPETIVGQIGLRNTYLVAFLFGALAGFSSFTGGAFYAAVATFAAGGSDPALIALAGGAGLFVSDSAFYYVASRGVQMLGAEWEKRTERFARWINSRPEWSILLVIFVYSAFVPLPSDILLIVLAISRYSYRRFAPFLALGDFALVALLAYFGDHGFISWITG